MEKLKNGWSKFCVGFCELVAWFTDDMTIFIPALIVLLLTIFCLVSIALGV